MPSKSTVIFYMISKISNEGQTQEIVRKDVKKRLVENIREQQKHLDAVDDTYEFQQIARHDVRERKWT